MGGHKRPREYQNSSSKRFRRDHSPSDYRKETHRRSSKHSQVSFDFERHKSKLVRIFFRESDLVPYGSNDYKGLPK